MITTLTLLLACSGPADPLTDLDAKYTNILVDLGVSERDNARNILNREARRRMASAEKARVTLFRDPNVQRVIEATRKDPPSDVVRIKADRYWRQMVENRAWTEDEKAEEGRLVGKLDELSSVEATWSSPDGRISVPLSDSWQETSRAADALPDDIRADLAREYVAHQARVAGADLVELVRLRNEVARREGFNNYWELSLAAQSLSPADVDAVIAELTEAVTPINQAIAAQLAATAQANNTAVTWENLPRLRRATGLEKGRDEADTFFDTDLTEERVTTFFQDMGIQTQGLQIYTGPSRYVRSGVDGFPIRPPDHVAIVMSQDRRWSVWQYEALAHEGGHAMWWRSLGAEAVASPVLWEPPPAWFEGFAQLFERLVYDPAFAMRYVPDLPAADREALASWRAVHMAGWITDSIVDTMVERRLYEDPTSLEAIARYGLETRAKLTGDPVPPPTPSGAPYDSSLTSSLLWTHPAYSQNYLFAYLTETWLHDAVVAAVGDPIGNPQVGPFLVNKLIHGDVTMSFPDRLAALKPEGRTDALKQYLKLPAVSN